MTQVATVIKGGENATVEISRKSACEMCHESGSTACTACHIFTSSKKASAVAKNSAGAGVGDIVEVESKETTILAFAVIVFLLPVALPLAAYLLFRSDMTAAIIISAAVFFVSAVSVYFISKAYEKKAPALVITKILKSNTESE
ncbi:MAG: SoxR reducing system RseC family protein [Clostridia bacterium]|nr:SoxR reducing system RseC family protein [Clostridia bacterium]